MRSSPGLLSLAVLALIALGAGSAHAADDKPMPEHKITQAESYVGLDPMYATILDNGKPAGLLLVSIGLDIPDARLRAEAVRAMPVLRDFYLRSLMAFTATAVRPWRQPDVDMIARRLQRVTDRALKTKGAQVLMGQIMIRISR